MGVNYILYSINLKRQPKTMADKKITGQKPNLPLSVQGGQLGPKYDWSPNYKEAPYKGVLLKMRASSNTND